MKVTITEKHLDKAIKILAKGGSLRTQHCLVAQACKEVYGDDFVWCSTKVIGLRQGDYLKMSKETSRLIICFDKCLAAGKYAAIRKKLPATVQFPDAPK